LGYDEKSFKNLDSATFDSYKLQFEEQVEEEARNQYRSEHSKEISRCFELKDLRESWTSQLSRLEKVKNKEGCYDAGLCGTTNFSGDSCASCNPLKKYDHVGHYKWLKKRLKETEKEFLRVKKFTDIYYE
jgi:hypothetical protein